MGCCCGKPDHPQHHPLRQQQAQTHSHTHSHTQTHTHQLSPTSKGEQECARVLQKLYPGHRFVKSRPDFLINPKTGRCLELDLYCPELKIAVEYNGRQHYEYTPQFHSNRQDFDDQVQRDRLKLKLCRKHGIKLIIVPYTVTDIQGYLKKKLKV